MIVAQRERPPEARSLDADPKGDVALLVVPHPAAGGRLFVLAPLADLAPGLVPPGWGRSVETARRRQAAREDPGSVRAIGVWDAIAKAWRPI